MELGIKFERLLNLFWNESPEFVREVKNILNTHADEMEEILADLEQLSALLDGEKTSNDALVNQLEIITKKLKTLIKISLSIPEVLDSDVCRMEYNAMIRAILQLISLSNLWPSYMYKDYITRLAQQIGMPEIGKETIELLMDQLKIEDMGLSFRHSQIRIRNSRKGGWEKMKESKIRGDEPFHLPVYETAYFEIINILKPITVSKLKNEECRQFRKRLKEWGKGRIIEAARSEMGPVLKQYKCMKIQQGKKWKLNDDIETYINEFFDDMEQVHQHFHVPIFSRKEKMNREGLGSELNQSFYFYLCLIYAYVKYYTYPSNRYLALYCLEQIYGANTISGILKQQDADGIIFREYIFREKQDEGIHKRKRELYIHKMYVMLYGILFIQLGVCIQKRSEKAGDIVQYMETLLRYVNCLLCYQWDYKTWGMPYRFYNPALNAIDYDIWFLYRSIILGSGPQKAESFFKDIDSGKKWLTFIYEWMNGKDLSKLEAIFSILEEYKLENKKKIIDGILYFFYEKRDIDTALKYVIEKYISEIIDEIEYGEKDMNQIIEDQNIKRKIPSHTKLIGNIYYDIYDNSYLPEKLEVLKKHKLFWRKGILIEDDNILKSVKYIINGRKGSQCLSPDVIKNFLWYLQNAPWIPANVTKYLTDDGKSI